MKQNKKGFTVVELIIVVVIIAILAAVLIPTFASIIKKAKESAYLQERTNQQIQDLTEKIENNNYMTWEDFEEKLAEALASLENPTAEQIKDAVLAAIGDKFNTTGLTEEQVRKIIDKALESQLTDAQVKAIVEAAIKNLSENSLTEAKVRSIVQSAINALPSNVGITKEQMTKAIADAIKTVSPGLSEEAVADAIAKALDNFKSELLTEEQVADLVQKILDSLQPQNSTVYVEADDPDDAGVTYTEFNAENVSSWNNMVFSSDARKLSGDITINNSDGAFAILNSSAIEKLNLNGHTMTVSGDSSPVWLNSGTLEIYGKGTAMLSDNLGVACFLVTGGNLSIYNGTFVRSSGTAPLFRLDGGTTTIYSGSFNGPISVASSAGLIIYSGIFQNSGFTIDTISQYVNPGSTITEENGIITVITP